MSRLLIEVEGEQIKLDNPIRISRSVLTNPEILAPQAFHLPKPNIEPVNIGSFIGDISKGGSCNVRTITFSPHNLTHVETSAHIITDGNTINRIPADKFHGLTYLMDLSDRYLPSNKIKKDDILDIDTKIMNRISILALKTEISLEDEHANFSDTDPIHLDPEFTAYLREEYPNIHTLLLDLPSADKEDDNGELQAHRNFFDIPAKVKSYPSSNMNKIVELGYFNALSEGYYYTFLTPMKIEVDAIITDALMFRVKNLI